MLAKTKAFLNNTWVKTKAFFRSLIQNPQHGFIISCVTTIVLNLMALAIAPTSTAFTVLSVIYLFTVGFMVFSAVAMILDVALDKVWVANKAPSIPARDSAAAA